MEIKDIQNNIDIYEMELHQTFRISSHLLITRVPGGWIYDRIIGNCDFMTSVFVEFDNEFMKGGRHYSEVIQ